MIQAHHLSGLCRLGDERTNAIWTSPRGFTCATNGQAALFVDAPMHGAMPGPHLGLVERLRWRPAGKLSGSVLRGFLRRKQERVRKNTAGFLGEPVAIRGVTVDAQLLRKFLPSCAQFETLRLSRALRSDPLAREEWSRAIGAPALRIDGTGWHVVIMAYTETASERLQCPFFSPRE